MAKILVIDDDRDICVLMNKFLSKHGYQTQECFSGKKALDILEEQHDFSLVLCDYRLDGIDGNEMLDKIKQIHPQLPVIIITGYNDLKTAVELMKKGAFDYVTKPLHPEELLKTIQQAIETSLDSDTNTVDVKPVSNTVNVAVANTPAPTNKNTGSFKANGDYIFGTSHAFEQIVQQISLVAPTDYSVIIYGESGSGKEAIAQEIHKRSKRSNYPFVAIDCGALSKELAGSELFGHEKGAFTGAIGQKAGSFELANGGTIFLDEIANLSYDIQVSLLRVIQERKMRRVGGIKDIPLDVRIIIASNERLWDAAQKGKFREDLFHRFNEFTIEVPPLRNRKEDVMVFAKHFLKNANESLGKNILGFSPNVEEILKNYVWYGNLRELKNVVKRAALLAMGDYVDVNSLPYEVLAHQPEAVESVAKPPAPVVDQFEPIIEPPKPNTLSYKKNFENSLKEASIDLEYEMILKALKETNFNKSKAAKLLNIDRKTLYNKIKLYQDLNNKL